MRNWQTTARLSRRRRVLRVHSRKSILSSSCSQVAATKEHVPLEVTLQV